MSFVAKLFVVFNFILAIIFLVFAMNVWTAQTKWRKLYEDEKSKNVEALAKVQKGEVGLAQEIVREQQFVRARDKDIADLKVARNRAQDDKLVLESKIAQLENAKDLAEAERQEVGRERQRVTDELLKLKGVLVKQQAAVVTERDNATKARAAAADMENELNVTKQTLAAAMRDKRAIEDDLSMQTRRIERLLAQGVPVFKFLNEDPGATQPAIADGLVLATKPDIGLVMISLGALQGVKPGYQFTISRGEQYISKVQVEKVYPDMCSARVLKDMKKGDVQVHDEARSQ